MSEQPPNAPTSSCGVQRHGRASLEDNHNLAQRVQPNGFRSVDRAASYHSSSGARPRPVAPNEDNAGTNKDESREIQRDVNPALLDTTKSADRETDSARRQEDVDKSLIGHRSDRVATSSAHWYWCWCPGGTNTLKNRHRASAQR